MVGERSDDPWVGHATGKDRTGVLAALILLTLGVDDELVCWDYEQTELGLTRTPRPPLLKRWMPWVRRSPRLGLAHPCRR